MKRDEIIGQKNAGFTIIEAIAHPSQHIDDAGRLFYVLGFDPDVTDGYADDAVKGKFVTWLYNAGTGGFASGNYFNGEQKEQALRDLYERASR